MSSIFCCCSRAKADVIVKSSSSLAPVALGEPVAMASRGPPAKVHNLPDFEVFNNAPVRRPSRSYSKHKIKLNRNDEVRRNKDKLYILVVDDSITIVKIAKSTIQKLGHDVDSAAHGQEALDMLKETEYDLVICDIQMPVMDGIQAVQLFRDFEAKCFLNETRTKRQLIIGISTDDSVDTRKAALEVGMDHFIAKPFRMEVLTAALSDLGQYDFFKGEQLRFAQAESDSNLKETESALVFSNLECDDDKMGGGIREASAVDMRGDDFTQIAQSPINRLAVDTSSSPDISKVLNGQLNDAAPSPTVIAYCDIARDASLKSTLSPAVETSSAKPTEGTSLDSGYSLSKFLRLSSESSYSSAAGRQLSKVTPMNCADSASASAAGGVGGTTAMTMRPFTNTKNCSEENK